MRKRLFIRKTDWIFYSATTWDRRRVFFYDVATPRAYAKRGFTFSSRRLNR